MQSNTLWLLPKKLDRKYPLSEKLYVLFFRDYWTDQQGYVRLKPYAIYRRFGKYGFTKTDPYEMQSIFLKDSKKFVYERRHYEADGFTFKTDEALQAYKHSRRIALAVRSVLRKRKNTQ